MSLYSNYTNQQFLNTNHQNPQQQSQQQQQQQQHHSHQVQSQLQPQQHTSSNYAYTPSHQPQPQHSSSNGTPARHIYHDDYLQRGYPQTSQAEMSVQLTRPTSKIALLVRQRRAMLEQLSCYLCKGYLIDATTIDECMDSFCKSCIVIHLRSHTNCPKCGTLIHKTNPLSAIRSDKVLQDIIYKLIPGLYDNEMKRRRDFYKGLYGTSSSDDDEEDSSGSFSGGRFSNMNSEQYGVISHPKSFYKPTDSIDLSIEPLTRGECTTIYYDNRRQSIVTSFTGNLHQSQQHRLLSSGSFSAVESQQFKTYLRCPAKLTALQLKKFIVAKFNLCKDDTVHLRYLNESLKDAYSLIDIAYIYDWRGIEHMRLYYIIERDANTITNNLTDDSIKSEDRLSRKAKISRQSVGTSTQTVKRVCIDPHPKYHILEQNNNSIDNFGDQRATRSKSEVSTNTDSIASATSQTLRSYSSTNHRNNIVHQPKVTNGSTFCREQITLRGQAAGTPMTNSISNAVKELSLMRQDREAKDTRSSRRAINESSAPIPKININLSSINKTQSSEQRNYNTKPAVKSEAIHKALTSTNPGNNHSIASGSGNLRQIVHYVQKGCSAATKSNTPSGPSSSSMITLANVTESRSSHVMAIASTSSTASITSNSYTNLIGATESKFERKSVEVKSNHISTTKTSQPQPQLAFSFVTERGITIVRSPGISTHTNNRVTTSLPAISAPTNSTSSQINSSGSEQKKLITTTSQQSNPSASRSPSCSTSSGTQSNVANIATGSSNRHHTKVKPVYKTFVDPTKLKSPNFKKFGFTARH